MQWLELKIDTTPAGITPVSELVEELGITGLVIEDEGISTTFWSITVSTGTMWTKN